MDADYAEKANDRRSASGIAITLGGAVVSHASKTQHVVCRIYYGWGRGQGNSVYACRFVVHCAQDEWGKH